MSYLRTAALPVVAGAPKDFGAIGRKFLLLESTDRVDIRFIDVRGQTVGEAEGVLDGLGITLPRDFHRIRITSATSQTLRMAFAAEDVDFTRVSGTVSANVVQAGDITHQAAVAVSNAVATALLAANGDRLQVVFHNPSTNTGAMYLGGSTVTAANAARILQPGDTLIDDKAAPAAWYAVAAVNLETLRVEADS